MLRRRDGQPPLPIVGLALIAYGGLYGAFYWLAVHFARIETEIGPITALWLPSGLQASALLLTRQRVWWPAIVVTGVVAELSSGYLLFGAFNHIGVAAALGNAGEAVVFALLVRKLAGTAALTLHRSREVVAIGLAAVVAPALNAAYLNPFFELATWGERWTRFHTYWIGDVTAIVALAPALVCLSHDVRTSRAQRVVLGVSRWELAGYIVVASAVITLVFGRRGAGAEDASVVALLWPMLSWAALRIGPTTTALSGLVVIVSADLFTRAGRGPYGAVADEGGLRVAAMQGFLCVLLLSMASLAAGLVERELAETALAQSDDLDPVTGLPTLEAVRKRVERSRPLGSRTAILVVDLDGFRDVNERFSRAVGDDVLRQVGERLRLPLRTEDIVARMSGDTFLVVIERLADVSSAQVTAERVLATLSAPVVARDAVVPVSACSGLAMMEPRESADRAMSRAVAALAQAQARGPGHSASLDAEAYGRLDDARRLQAQLQRAIGAGELEVHYQPIVDVKDAQAVVAVESLLRWNHPTRGVLMAGTFIPGAEASGLVVALDDWVLNQALADLRSLRARPGLREVTLFVNVSARTLAEPDCAERIRTALRAQGVAPTAVVIEITETALVDDSEVGRRAARELSGAGINLAIDDFGQGHASLARLRSLPISVVKIDHAFVSGMGRSEMDDAIVGWTTNLAQQLRMSTVAEGVERPEQFARLAALGVDFAQGYAIARPMPIQALIALIGADGRLTGSAVQA